MTANRNSSITTRRDALRIISGVGLTVLAPRTLADEQGFAELGCTPLFINAGPYYPAMDQLPWVSDLTGVSGGKARAKGQLLYVVGRITDSQCTTLSGAKVELWQADANGYYDHPVDTHQPTTVGSKLSLFWSCGNSG